MTTQDPVQPHAVPEVVTCGETMALIHASAGERLRHAASLRLRIGGAETNVAIALARLGRSSGWVSRVGDDELGQLVIERVRAEGVDVSRVRRGTEPTGLFLRDSDVNGTRSFYYRAGSSAAHMVLSAADLDYVAGARIVHLSGITPALSPRCRDAVEALIKTARDSNVTLSFDINYRSKLWPSEQARAFCERWLDSIDILFVGHEEAAALWPDIDDEALMDMLSAAGPAEVLFKRGGGHSSALIDGQRYDEPALDVSVVDTTGAGDAFAGGYLAARCAAQSAQACLRQAQAVGACCVTAAGDYENLPNALDLEQFLSGRPSLGR